MKPIKILFIISLLAFAGCAQAIGTFGIGSIEAIPKTTYTTYLYSSGEGGRLRAVLLKSPDADVEIIPYSVQITTATGTVENALSFMEKTGLYRNIYFQGVTYKGKTIGYLLTFGYHSFSRDSLEVNLYEQGGKIYFAVSENSYD